MQYKVIKDIIIEVKNPFFQNEQTLEGAIELHNQYISSNHQQENWNWSPKLTTSYSNNRNGKKLEWTQWKKG